MTDGPTLLAGEALARQAESLWRRGQRPDPDRLLVAAGATTPQAVAAVLAVDQWQRWQFAGPLRDQFGFHAAIAGDSTIVSADGLGTLTLTKVAPGSRRGGQLPSVPGCTPRGFVR